MKSSYDLKRQEVNLWIKCREILFMIQSVTKSSSYLKCRENDSRSKRREIFFTIQDIMKSNHIFGTQSPFTIFRREINLWFKHHVNLIHWLKRREIKLWFKTSRNQVMKSSYDLKRREINLCKTHSRFKTSRNQFMKSSYDLKCHLILFMF